MFLFRFLRIVGVSAVRPDLCGCAISCCFSLLLAWMSECGASWRRDMDAVLVGEPSTRSDGHAAPPNLNSTPAVAAAAAALTPTHERARRVRRGSTRIHDRRPAPGWRRQVDWRCPRRRCHQRRRQLRPRFRPRPARSRQARRLCHWHHPRMSSRPPQSWAHSRRARGTSCAAAAVAGGAPRRRRDATAAAAAMTRTVG